MNLERFKGKKLARRTICMIISVILMGCGTSMCFVAAMGMDPCSTMYYGISGKLGISFGVMNASANILLLIIIIIFFRESIGIGTIGNMFLVGFSADFFQSVWLKIVDPTELSMAIRVVITLVGISFSIFFCAVYMTANLGMAPYDSITFVFMKFAGNKIQYRWMRMIQDAVALVVGFLCGAPVGLGTILMVVFSGPLIQFFSRTIAPKIVGVKRSSVID